MKLSSNLTYTEAIKSNTAIRLGIDNEPTAEHMSNLIITANKIFQPIRDHFGVPIFISSGYRSETLNEAIGGSKTSQHSLGKAFDIDQDGRSKTTNLEVFNYIKDNMEFDQLILEFPGSRGNPAWVHASYSEGKNRNMILVSIREDGKTKYKNFTTAHQLSKH